MMWQIYPTPGEADLAEAYAYPQGRIWLRANMIASLDGAAWYDDGRSGGLSGAADRALLSTLRGLADAVIVGAETVRVEGYGPMRPAPGWDRLRAGRPPAPRLVIVSSRLDLDLGAPVFTESEPPVMVLTCEAAPREALRKLERSAEIVMAGRDEVDFRAAVAKLAALGHSRLLCEGGPRVLAQVAAAGVLDELCLTLSPLLVAGDADRILNGPAPGAPQRLRIGHILTQDDFLFLRYLR